MDAQPLIRRSRTHGKDQHNYIFKRAAATSRRLPTEASICLMRLTGSEPSEAEKDKKTTTNLSNDGAVRGTERQTTLEARRTSPRRSSSFKLAKSQPSRVRRWDSPIPRGEESLKRTTPLKLTVRLLRLGWKGVGGNKLSENFP